MDRILLGKGEQEGLPCPPWLAEVAAGCREQSRTHRLVLPLLSMPFWHWFGLEARF